MFLAALVALSLVQKLRCSYAAIVLSHSFPSAVRIASARGTRGVARAKKTTNLLCQQSA